MSRATPNSPIPEWAYHPFFYASYGEVFEVDLPLKRYRKVGSHTWKQGDGVTRWWTYDGEGVTPIRHPVVMMDFAE